MSEKTFYGCVNGFNNEKISYSDNKQYGRQFSAVIKTSMFLLESIKKNDG